MGNTVRYVLGLSFILGLVTACGSQQSERTQEPAQSQEQAEPSQVESQQPTTAPPKTGAPAQKSVSIPDYEIFDDSVDSTGMRLVYIGTADGFSAAQQRAIVADVLGDEKGKNRWVRVFVRPNSARSQVQRGECLESLNAGAIIPCNFAR